MTITPTRGLPAVDVALTMAELLEASDGIEERLATALERFRERAEHVGVPYSEAAGLLRVSVPTIRSWVSRGVLVEAEGLRIHAVTAASLGQTKSILDRLDESEPGRPLLMRLAEEIRDIELRREAATASRSGLREVTDEDLAAL